MVVVINPNIPYCSFVNTRVKLYSKHSAKKMAELFQEFSERQHVTFLKPVPLKSRPSIILDTMAMLVRSLLGSFFLNYWKCLPGNLKQSSIPTFSISQSLWPTAPQQASR
jgi:hypothetical protein